LSDSLANRWSWQADFLAARDWGPLRSATTEHADRVRAVLVLVFATGAEYRSWPLTATEATKAYSRIVAYVIAFLNRYGYNPRAYFEEHRIHIDIAAGNFRRRTADLKRDLERFEPDLPPTIDPNLEAKKLDLDSEETHLGLMAVAAGKEVAMRAATATPEELRRLRDLHRLAELRLDLYQKLNAAMKLPDPLQTRAQYLAAKSLVGTQDEIRHLEKKLFGADQVSEKEAGAREARRRASAFEKHPT
jgi:hypothetical protein